MRPITRILHLAADLLIVFALAGIPVLLYCDFPGKDGYDAVSSASIELPKSPSGEYIIFINQNLHSETTGDWTGFFEGDYLKVIFDDISCFVPDGDVNGLELARRYEAILPENQMTVSVEDAVLIASKTEAGYADVVIMSTDMADFLGIGENTVPDSILSIRVRGESDS